ncbi:polysaccharide lyase family 8 super-sandwich domain-containing protein [Rufibacter ruber]|uniref:polysaccharide lyase family 8 super-sandwich domain-containing protein n=1 Tax=Rufibacter ruber TaxID=1783499 RepID=UPI0008305074|nr:polysaccharide lyase family 8 super-sandwich domain-containing protein [Rufibacter ruber]
MIQRYKKAFLLVFLSLAALAAQAQSAAELETMYTRVFNTYNGPAGYDLSNQNADGTFKNVVYPAAYPTDKTGGPRPHFTEMVVIARAYHTQGPSYKSDEYLDAYCKAWNWWTATNPTDTNWWYRSIGWPNSLIQSFVLMAKDLKEKRPAVYNSLVSFLMFEWTPEKLEEYKQEPDAANTTEVCKYIMATAIVNGDTKTLAEVAEMFYSLIKIEKEDRTNGIQPDFAFNQHTGNGRQLYMGNYGKEYLGGISYFMSITSGTSLAVPDDKIKIYEDLFLHGVAWFIYRNVYDYNQLGRRILGDGYEKTVACLAALINENTPQKAKLQELYAWLTRPADANQLNVLQGNKMFWRHDYMVHKGTNYYATTRMTSPRTVGNESANGEGLNNFYTGSGPNYVYITGTEIQDIYEDMNWRRLPGVTAPQRPMSVALPTVPIGKGGNSLNPFAGGVSDGRTGAAGFMYNMNKSGEIRLSANKSWFYFPDYIVALGTDIKAVSGLTVPFTTTVNQVKYTNNFYVDNNGQEAMLANGQSLAPVTSNWAHLNNIGYQFINNQKLNFEVQTSGNTQLAWIAFNHGNFPAAEKYAYALYPNVTKEQLAQKISSTPFEVVSNTASVQCVVDQNLKVAQAVFFTAGRQNLPGDLGFLETDQPAVIQLRWTNDSLYVAAANPFCETSPVNSITVKVKGLYAGEQTTAEPSTQVSTVVVPMPSAIEFQGQSVLVGLRNTTVLSSAQEMAEKGTALLVYPSPVVSGAQFLIQNAQAAGRKEPQKVRIYSLAGLKVQETLVKPNQENQLSIATAGLAPGLYVVSCEGRVAKIVLQ